MGASALDARRIPAGMPITVRSDSAGSPPREIVFQLAPDRLLHVRRMADSTWTTSEERLPWVTDTLVVSGRIDENLYQALDDSATVLPKGTRAELAWTLADILEYRVDEFFAKIRPIAGIEWQALKWRRVWREEGGLRRTESDPDIVLSILEQRGNSVFRETVRVRWIVAITNEPRVLAIKSEQAIRQGSHP